MFQFAKFRHKNLILCHLRIYHNLQIKHVNEFTLKETPS